MTPPTPTPATLARSLPARVSPRLPASPLPLREQLAEITPPEHLSALPGSVLWSRGLAEYLAAAGLPPVTGVEVAAERERRRRVRTAHKWAAKRAREAAAETASKVAA